MNVVVLQGNLTRDPETKFTSGGTAVTNFALAVNRSVKKGEQWETVAEFFEVTFWSRRGEAFAKHHAKGDRALIRGRLSQDTWEDKNTGQKRSKVFVTAEEFDFVKSSSGDTGSDVSEQRQAGSEAPF